MTPSSFFFGMTPVGKMLLAGSAAAHIGLIALSLSGILPPDTADFAFFFFLATLAALYRPGWMFLLLLAVLPLETINLAPTIFGADLRPYQFLELAILTGLLIRLLSKKTLPELPVFGKGDLLLALVPIGSFLAIGNATSPAASLRLSLILLSFYGLYLLARIYLRSYDDVRRVIPFLAVSGLIVLGFAFFQGIRSMAGLEAFEVMPGRPNAMFPEPDWLGAYLVVLGAGLFAVGSGFRSEGGEGFRARTSRHIGFFISLSGLFSILLMTVSRSAWLGLAISGGIALALIAYSWREARAIGIYASGVAAAFFLALSLVTGIPLTAFDLSGRADSIVSGDQSITVSCEGETMLPEKIASTDELAALGCRHIDLEEIDTERSAGRFIAVTDRPDPNVDIRKGIYQKSWAEIREHPVLGIGWGSISSVLGTDSRGAGLNASNVFLEVWLGSGIVGLLGFVGFLSLALTHMARAFLRSSAEADVLSEFLPIFLLSALPGLLVFDIFNSGILLGFLWVLFAMALVERRPGVSRGQELRS